MTDLDHALRETLRERSADIATAPSWLRNPDFERAGGPYLGDSVFELTPLRSTDRRSLRRWPLFVAAAAVIVAIGVAASLLVALPTHPVRPADGPVRTVTRTTCVPTGGTAALAAATKEVVLRAPQGSLDRGILLAFTQSGGALIAYPRPDSSRGSDNGYDLGYVAANAANEHQFSSAPFHLLAVLPTPAGILPSRAEISAQVDGETAVVIVSGSGTIGRSLHTEIDTVDVGTGQRSVVANDSTVGPRRRLELSAVSQGIIYWQSGTAAGSGLKRIYARAVSGGPVRLLTTGRVLLSSGALGVTWNQGSHIDVPVDVPRAVIRSSAPTSDTLYDYESDGRSWAWRADDGTLAWYGPGAREVVRFPDLRPKSRKDTYGITAVVGPLVYLQVTSLPNPQSGSLVDTDEILDTRTGALTSYQGARTIAIGSRGVAWILGASGTGAHIATTALGRLDTAKLRPVAC